MRFNYLIASFVLLPLYAFSQHIPPSGAIRSSQYSPVSNYTLVKTITNESQQPHSLNTIKRTLEYPTQIIRTVGILKGQQLNCEQVNKHIEDLLVSHITKDKFVYSIYIACEYDPSTEFATQYKINSYFDPLNDQAIDYLKLFLNEYNGSDLLGTKLSIESAKGLIVSLNISAGIKKSPEHSPFAVQRQDRSNIYFNSNYELQAQLMSDAYQNFFTNDTNKVLPFLDKWLFSHAGNLYNTILKESNFTELQPEIIFLMGDGDIFISNLKHYFKHNCNQYENHRCLKEE